MPNFIHSLLAMLPADAQPHKHCGMSVARAWKAHDHIILTPWRVARSLLAAWSKCRSPTEHMPGSADLVWLCCDPTQGMLLPTPSAGAQPCEQRDRSVAPNSENHSYRVRLPRRAARALFAPWSVGRPPMEHTPRSADLAWLCCGSTCGGGGWCCTSQLELFRRSCS